MGTVYIVPAAVRTTRLIAGRAVAVGGFVQTYGSEKSINMRGRGGAPGRDAAADNIVLQPKCGRRGCTLCVRDRYYQNWYTVGRNAPASGEEVRAELECPVVRCHARQLQIELMALPSTLSTLKPSA